MSIPEQAGKLATSTIEGLKTNPSCLAAIVLAGMFAVLTFVAFQRDADRRARTVEIVLNRCFTTLETTNRDNQKGVPPP